MLARSVPYPLLSPSLLFRSNPAAPLLPPFSTRRRQRCLRISAVSDPLDLLRSLAPAIPSPAAALASAAATAALSFILSQRPRRADPQARGDAEAVAGCWILYTSPTPFNRCVLLRCPSVSFEDGGGDRLLRRDRHYVNLCCGSIPVCSDSDPEDDGISYQRLCVGTEDGGVISLDWPDDLDLEKEHGLDTTVLVVPGTAEGSMDKNVKMFVADALNHGYFPIVMNPRGCAGSPLTTARLFTAADSDDVSTAIQYINRLRPWTTMMSVACGYGANMLTKYLAEVREATPLTAAVCIDNPFDLDEATRSFPHHEAMDQKLRSGLIDILRANKEIFQGKAKGFNVAKALSATSIRDFDGALSMISYGFDSIEDFYSNLSTRQSVSNVKIPVLYIQSDDGTVPLFSVPRSSISENPFTSLLLCSCLESTIIAPERSAIHWCQHLAIEWLSAVELALLKGRHPLLKDVEITIKPSEGLAKSFSSDNEDNYLKLARPNLVNGFLSNSSINVFRGNGPVIQSKASSHLEPGSESHCGQRRDVETEQETSSNMSEKCGMVNEVLANKGDSEIDSKQSQVLQTAAVVMNMLDVTMPGTLDDEQKRKVLTAVEQGETLMKALQGAVPEDVCGKLTTAVTEILQTQSANLNLDGFRRIGWIPNVAPNMKSRMKKLGDNNASDQRQSDAGSEGRPEDDSARSNAGSNNTQEGIGSSQQQATKAAEYVEPDSEMSGKPNDPKKIEKASGGNEEVVGEQVNADQSHGVAQRNPVDDQVIENDATKKEAKRFDSEAEPVLIPSSNSEKACAAASSDLDHPVEKDENLILKNEGQISQDAVDQKVQTSLPKSEEPSPPPSKAPSISVTQALDALTGFDDSTQVAINSVFGVLENMIDQLEKANNQGKDDKVGRADNPESDIESRNSPISADKTEKICDSKSGINLEFDVTQSSNEGENSLYVEEAKCHEEVVASSGNRVPCGPTSPEKIIINYPQENNAEINDLTKGNINKVGYVQNFPVGVSLNPYWHSPYRTYFHGYFSTQLPVLKSMYSDSTTDLILDPKDGQWRMLDQAGHTEDIKGENGESQTINEKNISFSSRETDKDKIIEPSYIILDNEDLSDGYSTSEEQENLGDSSMIKNAEKELMYMIKDNILDALKVEVGRRLGLPKLEELETNLACDLEQVANSVSQAIVNDKLNSNLFSEGSNSVAMKLGAVEAEHIIKAVYSAVQEASHLRKVLPVGVIVGSTLASLRKHFQVASPDDNDHFKAVLYHPQNTHKELNHQECDIKDNFHVDEKDQHGDSKKSFGGVAKPDNNSDGIMVGAVTAALGASALLAHHQQKKINKCEEVMSNVKGFPHNEHVKIEEAVQEKNQNNLVSSLAEKAMSVAGPVVPTKGDGEVDHERLVAILAELGQKGGLLRLIGKIALLWGGIRGAMSLTDRLISFLRIAERPLFQRLFGFICMALVLWSPVVIPLLPTLVQSWTTKTSNGIAEYACILGLYAAVLILVILWGKRIRGYDNPLEQYGLDTASIPRVHHILKGLLGGVVVVLFTHSVNALLGFASLSWPLGLPSSSQGTMVLLKTYASALVLAVRGTMTAFCIALVEELLFRSWFPEEVAVDLGYYHAIVVSGLAFALAQRSLQSVPGFLLLSLALFGIKQRAYGKLYAPIGVRTGIMTANFILQNNNFLKYRTDTPFWLASTHPWHPFDGVVGLSVCGILAILFFPKQSLQNKKVSEDYLG